MFLSPNFSRKFGRKSSFYRLSSLRRIRPAAQQEMGWPFLVAAQRTTAADGDGDVAGTPLGHGDHTVLSGHSADRLRIGSDRAVALADTKLYGITGSIVHHCRRWLWPAGLLARLVCGRSPPHRPATLPPHRPPPPPDCPIASPRPSPPPGGEQTPHRPRRHPHRPAAYL